MDTTVQEKAISFPTDAKLYQRMRKKLVSKANECGIVLRQSYVRKGKQAFEGNPFDGHTLSRSIEQAERLGSFKADEVYVDRGYRGHDYKGNAIVHIVRLGWRKLPRSLRRWLKRRSAIEAVIGHSKNECRLGRNYLLGVEGDRINAILSGCGYNIRRLLRAFIFWLHKIIFGGWFYSPAALRIITQNQF